MSYQDSHLSDEQLLQDLDGESSAGQARQVQLHLSECWKCRSRRQELENAISEFVRFYDREHDAKLPSADGPRALLKARLSQASLGAAGGSSRGFALRLANRRVFAVASLIFMLLGFAAIYSASLRQARPHARKEIVSFPDSRLTPGATLLVSEKAVCSAANINNKIVPASLRRQVFQSYGIAGAEPRRYEVDYLITPALGGADDIHNLWPQSLSATVWNARVKDALEDRLREMVCDGTISLAQAQREIATNWIAAYQKYFHTDQPLANDSETSSQ